MIGVIFPEHIRKHPQLTTSDKMVWLAIRNLCRNCNTTESLQDIADYVDLTKNHIGKKIPRLEELGLIKRHANSINGWHKPYTYEVL